MARPEPALRYTEISPGEELSPWIECYWSIRAEDSPPVPNRVLPDGCADVIVGVSNDRAPVVVGVMRKASLVPLSGGVDLFGVRFRSGRSLPFLGVPLGELTDRRVPLEEVWGVGAGAIADACAHADVRARVTSLEPLLLRRLRRHAWDIRGDQALVTRAVELLRRARGSVGVRDVAGALEVGERQLQRAFDRLVGIGPKALGRVLRFRHAVRVIQGENRRPRHGWGGMANGAGFADQSHLIREFRSLAGITPAQYAAEVSVGFVQYSGDRSP